MRQTYHLRLDDLGNHGARMCRLAGSLLENATTALLDANLLLAETVIDAGGEIDRMRSNAENVALELLARESPVASDLRAVVSALWIVADLQRMGTLAIHVAKSARRRYPDTAIPATARSLIQRMGASGVGIAKQVEIVLKDKDIVLARRLQSEDAAMDALQQQVFASLLSPSWTAGVAPAVDLAMLGRFYERFADHAVAVANRVIFLVTGDYGTDTALTYAAPQA